MEFSHNKLVIQSLSIEPENGEHFIRLKAEMIAEIKFYCSVTNNHFRSLIIKSEGQSTDEISALKEAIQNFLNGHCYARNIIYNVRNQSVISKNIHHAVVDMPEPFKSLFEDLFDMNKWEIPIRELGTVTQLVNVK